MLPQHPGNCARSTASDTRAAAGYRRNWRSVLAGLRLDDAALQLPTIESAAVPIPR